MSRSDADVVQNCTICSRYTAAAAGGGGDSDAAKRNKIIPRVVHGLG